MAWRNGARSMARSLKVEIAAAQSPFRNSRGELDATLRHFATSASLVPPPRQKFAYWKAAGFAIAGLGTSVALYSLLTTKPSTQTQAKTQPYKPREPPSLGGPFKLMNEDGKAVSSEDFQGKWVLIYFGYTCCPEDCPKQLQKIADVVRVYEAAGKEIVPVFITLDPERDSAKQVAKFAKEFHPKFVGLRGTAADLRPVLWKYRVFFKKTAEVGSDYLVEHSSGTYLINRSMECVKSFGPEYGLEALVDAIGKEMGA